MKIKDCNVETDGRKFLSQPVKDDIISYKNIGKSITDSGDD